MYTVTEQVLVSSTTFLTGAAKSRCFPQSETAGSPTRPSEKKSPYQENEIREAAEIADALDRYKLLHRRRYVSFEEMIGILRSLGYRRT